MPWACSKKSSIAKRIRDFDLSWEGNVNGLHIKLLYSTKFFWSRVLNLVSSPLLDADSRSE